MVAMAIEKITKQQPPTRNAVWAVGEQLKDMCRQSPGDAEILSRDLDVPAMSLAEAEKQIKAYADKHKTGNFACVTLMEAEKILRGFYGLSEKKEVKVSAPTPAPVPKHTGLVDLADFL